MLALNVYAPFVWCDCVRTVLWYLCTGCVISGCIRTVVLCASLWLCVYVPFVWYLCVWIVCAYMCVHAVGVISVCMYRLRVMSVYTHRFPDSCMYVSFVLICWLSFVCVDARSSDCFVDRSQPSPFTQPSPYVSTTQPTNHSTIHPSTPLDHIHQIPANPGTLVQPRERHTMHLSRWWLKPFCMREGRPTFQPTVYSNQRSIAIIMLWPTFQPALHTPLFFIFTHSENCFWNAHM